MEWIEAWRHEALTAVFTALTGLGSVTFFLVAFTLGFWLVDRRVFLRVSLALMIAGLLNGLLKGVFQAPRPEEALWLVHANGWSLPSGHALIAATVWPWLARETRRPWTLPLAVLLALVVAASRVYLGVHFPRDIVTGLLIGGALSLALWWLADMAPAVWQQLRWIQKAALVAVPVTLLLWVLPVSGDGDDTAAKAGGALIGLALGADWERRNLRFRVARGWRMLGVAVVGLLGIFVLRLGLKAAFGALSFDPIAAAALRYGLIGLFLSAGAPWLFVRLGWCAREAAEPAALQCDAGDE